MADYKFPLLMKSTATGLIVLVEGITGGSGRSTRVKGIVKGTGNGCRHTMGSYRKTGAFPSVAERSLSSV